MIILLIFLILLSGCIDMPLDIEDIESREEIKRADLKQVLKTMYGVPFQWLIDFRPTKSKYRLYTYEEIERGFMEYAPTVRQIPIEISCMNCQEHSNALRVLLTLDMPCIPAFIIDVFAPPINPDGHRYILVFYKPENRANIMCLLLDYRYEIDHPMAIKPLDLTDARIGRFGN